MLSSVWDEGFCWECKTQGKALLPAEGVEGRESKKINCSSLYIDMASDLGPKIALQSKNCRNTIHIMSSVIALSSW